MIHTITLLDQWTETCRALFPTQRKGVATHPIHTCIIGGHYHFVHAPKLAEQDPTYFKRLERYAAKLGAKLLADRRSALAGDSGYRRKALMPVIFLALGVSVDNAQGESIEAALNMLHPPAHTTPITTVPGPRERIAIKDAGPESRALRQILLSRLVVDDGKRAEVEADIAGLADYYANHPEATHLLTELAQEEWTLEYAPGTFRTTVKGSRMTVDAVTVHFDPRSAAQLKFYDKCGEKKPFCVASPADALLHELLHAYTILKHTKRFIAQGGLSQHMYPYEHEQQTIRHENQLYAAMSRRDNQPRPIRQDHTGQHVMVSCVTCIE
jgi:hypothetical protein